MRTLTALVLTLALLPASAAADGEGERAALTSYEAGPLKDAGLVVVGETMSIDSSRRQQIAKVRIERVLLGEVPARPLLVLVQGPRPSTPLGALQRVDFPPAGLGRHVFFLGLRTGALAADFRDAFEAAPPLGDVKIAALEKEIALSRIPNEERRRLETRDYLVAGLTSKRTWTRVHAAKELRRFAAVCPSLLRAEDIALVRRLLRGRLPRDQREHLQKLSLWIDDQHPDTDRPSARPAMGVGAWQQAFEAATPEAQRTQVDDLFQSVGSDRALSLAWWAFERGDADLRTLVMRRLGDLGDTRQRKRVRGAYTDETDAGVRDAIVRAIGSFADAEDTAWLAERSANPRLQRTAWLALARVRSAEALAFLRRAHAALAESASDQDRRTAAWLAYLLSDRFPRADGR